MATVTHHIRSYYNPEDRETLELETGQDPGCINPELETVRILDPEEEWRQEAARIPIQRPQRAPPQFVPATLSYDEWSFSKPTLSKDEASSSKTLGRNLSGWYRSLTSKQTNSKASSSKQQDTKHGVYESQPLVENIPKPAPMKVDSRNKNNWFIMKAIQSEAPSASSSSSSTPTSTLADILSREPPPLPSQEKFTPPVWLEIGPSNKGFGMLQRSGWNEGEPLGPDVIRRKPVKDLLPDEDMISSRERGKEKARSFSSNAPSRREVMEMKMTEFDDVSELRSVDVIDLTLSDSDLDDGESLPDFDKDPIKHEEESTSREMDPPKPVDRIYEDVSSPYRRKALLTPIATVLKSDRLGIGLKAKTEGIYKSSKKRVTHGQAALAAHVKAAEESRIRRKHYGRGRKGFEKQHRREEENRKAMLAYLKGS
ncbi:hypothetical protein JR316_0006926 [Psilocybe cubensis]|uniref:G-patch domain-containing protein n=2 Tax=Psilocybe cubensis TaxID=181762 RepID=A0A8H8CN69_PSICU|nr:hypothetical protein JR316_0006926 [Psilocybe cubensis]KAH9480328.1 hypothetical protein JR316_0006926 [Psilocybe cubensis]